MLPAYADLWSQTSPIPNADPEISLFLHGAERSSASVQIVWRADLAEGDFRNRESVAAILDVVPPRSGEAVEIPLWAVRAWLQKEPDPLTSLSDTAERVPETTGRRRGKWVFRYAGSDDERHTRAVFVDELRDGDLIVVPAAYGGCDQWGWAPGSGEPVKDLAEGAAEPYAARRFAVRVTPELIHQWLLAEHDNDAEAKPDLDAVRRKLCTLLAEGRQGTASGLLDAVLDLNPMPTTIKRWLELLRHARGQLERAFCYGYDDEDRPLGVTFIARRGIKASRLLSTKEDEGGIPTTEDDRLGSTPGYMQTLDQHSDEVRDKADEFTQKAGLDHRLPPILSSPLICTTPAKRIRGSRRCCMAATGLPSTRHGFLRNLHTGSVRRLGPGPVCRSLASRGAVGADRAGASAISGGERSGTRAVADRRSSRLWPAAVSAR